MKKLLAGFLLLGACETQPTKVFENSKPVNAKTSTSDLSNELTITDKTIFVDTRSAFLFNLSHMPGAINLGWQEFAETNGRYQRRLVKDLYHSTRRLARLGIGPDSSIVVIGDGRSGQGEEGRLAWTLRYLGISDVHFAGKDYFDQTKWIHAKAPGVPRASVPPWKPALKKNLIVEFDELQKLKKASPGVGAKSLLIDVRNSDEFLKRLPYIVNPNVKVLNIEWHEFIDEKGRPNNSVGGKLSQLGVGAEHRIVVLGESGVESGLVVEALLALGFFNSGHFVGGMRELAERK